jgi:uncharacterized protein YaaQ
VISFFVSCSKSRDDEVENPEDDYFVYSMENIYTAFDVDETNTLYYTAYVDSGRADSFTDKNGKIVETPIMETKLYAIDADDKLVNTYILGDKANNGLHISDGKAYYTTTLSINPKNEEQIDYIDDLDSITNISGVEEINVIDFYSFDLNNQITNKIFQITDFDSIRSFEVINNKIYFLGIDNKRLNKKYTLVDENDTYYFSGEVMGVIDLEADTVTELPIDFPIVFAKTKKNNLMIYAHDGEKGYYFTEYDTANQSLSEKIYRNLDMLIQFDIYNNKNDVIYNSFNTSSPILSAAFIDTDNVTIELMPEVGTNYLVCQGDYTYYANNFNSGRIERIKTSSYIRGNKSIQMLSSDTSHYMPFGCGYIIERRYPLEESLALSVLSQDDNYDVCLVSSRQSISANIRNKASFYPLNEVDGVSEYLDACFPYIKEAAITKDGDIWMFPISVAIPCFIYNERYCKDNRIDLSAPMELNTLLDEVSLLRRNSEAENRYSYSEYILTENALYQYLRNNTSFDNNDFMNLAKLLKDKVNYKKSEINAISFSNVSQMLYSGNTNSFLFNLTYYQEEQLVHCNDNNLRAASLPYIGKQQSNIATCIYLIVNPSSRNLKSTLNYISSLSYYLKEKNDLMIFSDRSLYSKQQLIEDLYKIYSNGDIQFTLPNELFMNDYERYLNDEIELSTLIQEANRKIDAFLKE